MMLSVHAVFGQSQQLPKSSAESSKASGIPVDETISGSEFRVSSRDGKADFLGACVAAANELTETQVLVEALEKENRSVKESLETEKRAATLMQELIDTRKHESDALKVALTSKNEAIAAKDAVIDSQSKLIEALKKKKASPWRRLGDALIGAAVFAIFK